MKARSVLGALFIAASSANASGYLYLAAGTDDQGGSAARVFALNENGTPSALQSVNASGTFYNAVSMTPDGKYLYMADYNGNTIGGYAVGADGKLTNLPGFPLELPPDYGPYGSAVTPDGKFAVFGL